MTPRYAVVGNPVGHSLSPRIHRMFSEQTGRALEYEAMLAPLDGFVSTSESILRWWRKWSERNLPVQRGRVRLGDELR